MRLVVALGNPGQRYAKTRHNVGWMVAAELAMRYPGGKPKARFHGEVYDYKAASGESVLILCPTTYMNRSGLSAQEAVRFYKLPVENVLVVCDDLNLPFCKLRFRSEGGSGGQKGLADVVRALGTEKVARLRLGIGEPPGSMDAADFVLMNFTEKEQPEIAVTIKQAADAVEFWIASDINEAMNRFNGR